MKRLIAIFLLLSINLSLFQDFFEITSEQSIVLIDIEDETDNESDNENEDKNEKKNLEDDKIFTKLDYQIKQHNQFVNTKNTVTYSNFYDYSHNSHSTPPPESV